MGLDIGRYEQIDAVLTRCGAVRDMYEFCVYALKSVQKVIPFDYGRVYYLDDKAHVFDERLFGPRKELAQEYHTIYAHVDAGAYSITRRSLDRRRAIKGSPAHSPYAIYVRDWETESRDTRFVREYISRLGIRYSTGMAFFDTEDRVRPFWSSSASRLPSGSRTWSARSSACSTGTSTTSSATSTWSRRRRTATPSRSRRAVSTSRRAKRTSRSCYSWASHPSASPRSSVSAARRSASTWPTSTRSLTSRTSSSSSAS